MAQITDFVTGFSGPIGMALNGDDLYVVDVVASKIVKIDLTATPPTATDVVTGLSDPRQLLIDGNDIYVAETNYNKISKIDLTDTPPKARTLITDLSGPQGMILIGNELYIAEIYGDKISKINIEDSTPTTVDVITGLTKPIQFVLNGDDLYISESVSNSRISKIDITDPSPTATAVVSTGIPNFITLYENEIYISDQTEKKITKFDITAAKPTKIDVVTELNQPAGIAIKDDILYISEYSLRKIVSTQLTLSSNEGMFAENIRLFPNPSSAFVEVSGLSKTNHFKIYNTLGKEVSSGFISTNKKIDVGDLTPGLYILKLGSERAFKLVIE